MRLPLDLYGFAPDLLKHVKTEIGLWSFSF